MPKNNYPTFKNRSGIGSGLGYSAPPVDFFESIKNRLNNAGEALTNVQPYDAEDYGALPNEQLAGQGMRNVFNAAGAMQPPPVDLGDGAQWMPTIGALKPGVPFERLRELLAGKDPTELSPEAFGRYMKRLGPNIEDTATALVGARDLDKYGTNDMRKIVAQKWAEDPMLGSSLIPPPKLYQAPLGGNAAGVYGPPHRIVLDPVSIGMSSDRTGLPREPELSLLGVAAHETQHAIERKKYPDFVSNPELLGNSPKQIESAQIGRIIDRLNGAPAPTLDSHQVFSDYHSSINSPYSWTPGLKFNSEFVKDIFGRNPYGAQIIKSGGHFKDFNAFEFEYPQKTLAIENILKGGDVHPDIVKRYGLDPYFDQYKGGRQISNPWEKP